MTLALVSRLFLSGQLLLILLGVAGPGFAAELNGKVVSVSDGDTVSVLDGEKQVHRVRLAGIDAPERRQAFGARARQGLSSLVFGKSVAVIWKKKDRYGRLVGVVMSNDEDVNLRMLSMGLAWHYKAYEAEQPPAERLQYSEVEEQARSARIGLWSDSRAIPPWEFRNIGPRK